MGIRGMMTFLREEGPTASEPFYRRINLRELGKSHGGHGKAVIIVDVMSILNDMYYEVGQLDGICGGQQVEYMDTWKSFIESFEDANIELKFVADGPCPLLKRDVWIQRKCQMWDTFGKPVFDSLRAGQWPKPMGKFNCKSTPLIDVVRILRSLGQTVFVADGVEADELVAQLAVRFNAVGVMSKDTDYVAYQCPGLFLVFEHFNLKAMTAMAVDRAALARHLGIEIGHLPLLAVLKGCDMIPIEMTDEFHRRLLKLSQRCRLHHSTVMHRVCLFIRRWRVSGSLEAILKELKEIVDEAFRWNCELATAQRVIQGYYLKSESRMEPEVPVGVSSEDWSSWLSVVARLRSAMLRTVALYLSKDLSFTLQDYRAMDPPLATEVLAPAWQRIYGVILRERPGALGVDDRFKIKVSQWTFEGTSSMKDGAKMITPAEPPVDAHPGLAALLKSGDGGRGDGKPRKDGHMRIKLFIFMLSPKLDQSKLESLSPRLVPLAIALHALQHEGPRGPVLFGWEVRAFIVQRLLLPKKSIEQLREIILPHPPDPRGTSLASLFMNIPLNFAHELTLLAIPNCTTTRIFDGLLFMDVYLRLRDGGKAVLPSLTAAEDLDLDAMEKVFNLATDNGRSVFSD
jgi:hypothetical protein